MRRETASISSRHSSEVEVEHLLDLDLKELRARWRRLFRRDAPPTLSRSLLTRMIEYQRQANEFGNLDINTKRLLRAVGTRPDMKQLAAKLAAANAQMTTVTLLVREWKGEMHRVTVHGKEFVWKDQSFKSLSQIATAITGTRWNGPRFFGLRDKHIQEGK